MFLLSVLGEPIAGCLPCVTAMCHRHVSPPCVTAFAGVLSIGAREEAPPTYIHAVADELASRGWTLGMTQWPPSLHICVTGQHAAACAPSHFVLDLQASAREASGARESAGAGPRGEGMAARGGVLLRDSGVGDGFAKLVLDVLYSTGEQQG